MTKVILKKNEERRIAQGHLWVFSNEIFQLEGTANNGDLIEVTDSKKNFLAFGFYNANSLIAVRVISRDKEINLAELLESRILSAYSYRKLVYPNRESFRLVFSESDYLPGLIIDKYNNTFILQVYSYGMNENINTIITVLKEKLGAVNIFTKHDEYFRKLEGLPIEDQVYLGERVGEEISDGNVKYVIDFEKGQKTGFYFDQCDNREFFGKFCKDKTVLDCFSNSGGFGLHAALNSPLTITFVDSSSTEIENAKSNFALNNFSCKAEYVVSDVFDYLEKCVAENIKFDVVNIDPPAFAKNKKSLAAAIKGYQKLNRLALEVLNKDGLLFSSSCSHHLHDEDFLDIIRVAGVKSGKAVQRFYYNNASLDHPSLPAMDETIYLKFGGFRVIE